jgi:hypothetical protein
MSEKQLPVSREFSVNDLVGLDEDNEDHAIYARRERDKGIERHPNGYVTNWNRDSCGNYLC